MHYKNKTLHIKQGETFSFTGAVMLAADQSPVDTTGLTATSQICHNTPQRQLIAELTCQWLDDAVLHVRYDGSTAQWPVAHAVWDVKLADEHGQVRVTQTIEVIIEPHVTR